MSEFKVGDTVRVIKKYPVLLLSEMYQIGETFIVSGFRPHGSIIDDNGYGYDPNQLELVTNTNLAIEVIKKRIKSIDVVLDYFVGRKGVECEAVYKSYLSGKIELEQCLLEIQKLS